MSRPDVPVEVPDLAAVEGVIRRAIDERKPDLISAIGNGEFSIAMRWDGGAVPCVVKRVPPFPSRNAANQYAQLVHEHLAELRTHGIRCVTTDLHTLERADGSAVTYHCQPLLDLDTLADRILQRAEPDGQHPVLLAVVDTVVRLASAGIPLDAQFANWCWYDEEIWQLDFSTPLMLDERGKIRFDATGFLREYPAPFRPIVFRELMKIAPRYNDVEFVLTDVLVQFYRQGLEQWVQPYTDTVRRRHGIALSPTKAKKQFEEDSRFFPMLLRLKRVQRAWVQRTRRRYDTLLPATTSFGK